MKLKTSNQPELDLGFGDYTCNWGIHIAGLYETEEERDEILLGYLHSGALAKDLQFYCPVEQSLAQFKESYRGRFRDHDGHLEDTALFSFSTARELYYPDGTFSPLDMDKGLNEFYAESQKNGPRNVRATAEMVWALEAIPGREHLMAYESRLNYFIPGKTWISICLYNVTKFDGATIMNVLRTHPWVINRGVLTENPYFEDPDVWLKKNAPEFLP